MQMMVRNLRATAFAAVLLASPAAAAVEGVPSSAGFAIAGEIEVPATLTEAWAHLVDVGRWWSSQHSWSGDAHNMRFEQRAGGCWCEAMPNGGSIMHGQVIAFVPGERLLIAAELGPLQSMPVTGKLEWRLAPTAGGRTMVRYRYQIWGQLPGGDPAALANAVDRVMAEQVRGFSATFAQP